MEVTTIYEVKQEQSGTWGVYVRWNGARVGGGFANEGDAETLAKACELELEQLTSDELDAGATILDRKENA